MSIPSGFRQIGALDLLETLAQGAEEERDENGLRARRRQIKAQAHAQVCAMYRIKHADMTPQHVAYAEAIERRMLGEGTHEKGYGFSIDASGRKPNVR